MDFHTTDPYQANPFASTVDDPRELQKRVLAVMARAERRLAKVPHPRSYWEEPGHHGLGKREISLRKPRAVEMFPGTKTKVRKALRLPPLPKRSSIGVGTIAIVAVGAIGAGVLIGYLWNKRRREFAGTISPSSAHVGDDMSGLELWGCAS